MKVSRIETIPLAIPHDSGGPPPAWGGRAWDALNILLVRVEDEEGAVGWGESFSYKLHAGGPGRGRPYRRSGGSRARRDRRRGPDARAPAGDAPLRAIRHHHVRALRDRHCPLGPRREAGRVALGQLLGGPATPPLIPGYASLLKYRDPDLVAEKVREALDEGYPAIKLHETEEPEVAVARETMGEGVPLCVDTNCPWTPAEAREMAARLAPYDLHWLEEPIFRPRTSTRWPGFSTSPASISRAARTPAPLSSSGTCSTRARSATRSRA